MSAKQENFFSSDEEDYEPELNGEEEEETLENKLDFEDEDLEDEPKFSEQDKIESQKKLDRKNEIKQKIPDGIRLFLELEDKTEEALASFTDLSVSTYSTKSLGSSGQGGEFMSCECRQDWNGDINEACIDDDCINRGTKIECINGHSSCGDSCSNQRFQKKQYAPINVIQTAKKGYGVRAQEDIEPDTFIYEYIGEVIDEKQFKKRMIEYDELNFKHFYFMMLQKGEFIDATRKGCLARFCNHSCNPNCYVEKWVVGKKLRMGIFAKRRILKGEEVTFDYNVDRYGANAQPCYCGEPNCIGFIGGKTQTEAASLLPQFISEALGSTIEDEQEYLRGKQEKGEKIVKNDNNMNVEYINSLVMKPIDIFEINKVMGVLLQCEESLIAEKLIQRIELSTQRAIQYKLSYAHGYTSLGRILKNYYEDDQQFKIDEALTIRILKILQNWPKVSKTYINKVEIIPIINDLIKSTKQEEIKEISQELLDTWSSYEEFQRIRKSDKKTENNFVYDTRRQQAKESSPVKHESNSQQFSQDSSRYGNNNDDLPRDWKSALDPSTGKTYYYNEITQETSWKKPVKDQQEKERAELERKERELMRLKKEQHERNRQKRELEFLKQQQMNKQANDLAQIIENAKKAEEERVAKEKEIERLEEAKKLKKEEYKRKLAAKKAAAANGGSTPSGSSSSSSSSVSFERNWSKFFAQYVPNMLKKYRDEIGHDNVKQCAKDVVKILVEKEQKKKHGKKPPAELEHEKRKKVKTFIESYMEKFLIKYRAKHQKRKLEGADEETNNKNHNGGTKKSHTE